MTEDGNLWERVLLAERRLERAIDELIGPRLWAGGFPCATYVVCSMGESNDWGRVDLVLQEVHDGDGLIAHADHLNDRSTRDGQRFDQLAADMELELGQVSRVKALEFGLTGDDSYWGPVVLIPGAHGFQVLLPEWDDEVPDDLEPPPPTVPSEAEVSELVAAARRALRDLDELVAAEATSLRRDIARQLRGLVPGSARSVEVSVEVLDWPPPSVWVSSVLDAEGNDLEIELDVDDVPGLEDYVRLTEAEGTIVFDLSP